LQNLLSLFFWWHGQLEHHVESANKSRVQATDGIGQPKGRHGVFFERSVDPGLSQLCCALATKEPIPVVENILDFIKYNQCLTLREKALRCAEGSQAVCTIDRIAVNILAGDLKQFTSQLLGHGTCQLTFASSWCAVQIDVYSLSAI
jgi:hypothetical protein